MRYNEKKKWGPGHKMSKILKCDTVNDFSQILKCLMLCVLLLYTHLSHSVEHSKMANSPKIYIKVNDSVIWKECSSY